MAELIPAWPFVIMSEENVILKNKERGFCKHAVLNSELDTNHIGSPQGKALSGDINDSL